jgi:hypothetical protein
VGDRATPGLLGLLLFVSYAYFVSPPSWNENSRFDLVRSLVERHRLDIDPYEHDTGDKSFRDGHTYSDKAPGASFLAVPAYAAYYGFRQLTGGSQASSLPAAGHREEGELPYLVNAAFRRALYVCNLSTNAIAGALLGVAFFVLLRRRLGVAARPALTAALSLGLGSLVFPYATMFYGHVLAALFLFVAFVLITERDPVPPRHLIAAGVAAGLAVLTELPSAPVAVLLGACAFAVVRPRRQALWYVAGAAGPLLLLLAYQYAAFGGALRPGYALVSRPEFAAGMSHGVLGVGLPRPAVLFAELFGRARGLLYLSPVLVLGFVGLARRLVAVWADRPARTEVAVASAVVLYFLLMNAGYYMWYGGSALGPRHVIPALPFLCLGIPFAFRRPRPILVGALVAVSIINQLVATAVQPTVPLVRDVLFDHVYPHLLRGEVPAPAGPSNLGTLLGLRGPASLVPLVLLWSLALPSLVTRRPAPVGADVGSP